MSGPTKNLGKGWKLLEDVLSIEAAGPEGRKAGRYLGCQHIKHKVYVEGIGTITVMEYGMEDYLRCITEDYVRVATKASGKQVKLTRVKTPFLEEDTRNAPARNFTEGGLPGLWDQYDSTNLDDIKRTQAAIAAEIARLSAMRRGSHTAATATPLG